MKNSTLIKGSAAIVLGGSLLLGGGGTLANWNAAATQTPGTIVAGDLNVVNATSAGVWKDRLGATIDISTYKVVPGDKLTYTQDLTVTLKGSKMAANIAAIGTTPANGFADTVTVTGPALTVGGTAVTNPLKPLANEGEQTVTATITFNFNTATADRTAVNATYNFGNVGFTLTQINSANDGLS